MNLLLVLGFLLSATVANADPITFNLGGSSSNGSYGNSRSYTAGGITLTATAWAYTYGAGNNALESAALGRWSTGLGVCDRNEGLSCGDPAHQVDNSGPDNWVLFRFGAPVDPLSVRIDPYGTWDRDATYWSGYIAGPFSLTGKTYADLAALGFGPAQTNNGTYSTSPRDVPIDNVGFINALLFGPPIGDPSGNYIDRFKITNVTVETVPEPGTLLLMGAGVASLAARRRRAK